jgi:hypothetical protein
MILNNLHQVVLTIMSQKTKALGLALLALLAAAC